jgi:Zn-dependent protease
MLTIGRISGVDIQLHPTFALVFVWVFIDWRHVESQISPVSLLFTALLVVLIFASVLVHEFGHVFMAKHHGVRVHDVSLSAVGGVARMDQLPVEPQAEVMIALAGPAANLAIVMTALPILLLTGIASGFSSVHEYVLTIFHPSPTGIVATLIFANLLIILFNVLPAFPMDGGRVFRASLSAVLGRERATSIAVVVGQVLALIVLLLSIFVAQSVIMALLAIFIMVVAYAEGRAVRIESTLRRMRVGQFALWDMGGIAPEQPLAYALRGGPRDLAVTRDGRVLGMLWRNRLLEELSRGTSTAKVADVMDQNVKTVDVDATIYDVQRLMAESGHWAIPVTEAETYRGVFTGDRFMHIYRQLTPDPLARLRELAGFILPEQRKTWS